VNKFVLVGPQGQVVWDYIKATRVPGRGHIVGDGQLPRFDSEYGVLSAGICFDLDFPRLMAQAGRMNADIVFQPADTWPEVKWLHARMGRLRAIEQGFTLVRSAREGVAMITDPLGRLIAMRDTDVGGIGVLVADVPMNAGIRTIYSRTGDVFAWICVGGLAIASAAPVLGRRRAQTV
jgi:apolipoprotein N-acyltransferase